MISIMGERYDLSVYAHQMHYFGLVKCLQLTRGRAATGAVHNFSLGPAAPDGDKPYPALAQILLQDDPPVRLLCWDSASHQVRWLARRPAA